MGRAVMLSCAAYLHLTACEQCCCASRAYRSPRRMGRAVMLSCAAHLHRLRTVLLCLARVPLSQADGPRSHAVVRGPPSPPAKSAAVPRARTALPGGWAAQSCCRARPTFTACEECCCASRAYRSPRRMGHAVMLSCTAHIHRLRTVLL